ncbi:MAG: amidohydrolase family protein [Nitratireductor sp.]|nr:amidohydrolase family protein [Nitratireductor sp.]
MTQNAPETQAEPAGIDSHVYILDPARFAYAEGIGYRPLPHEIGPAAQLMEDASAQGFWGALAVQSSPYAYDNRAVIDAAHNSAGRIRFIGMFRPATTAADLARLMPQGLVGCRFNLVDFDGDGLVHAAAGPLLSALSELRLWTEVTASPRNWAELIPMFRAHRSPLLVDHLGGCLAGGQGPLLPDHDTLRRLADLEDVCLKISSVNRISMQREAFSDLDDLVADAVDLFGLDRLVWGSGWPFINQARPVDYTALTDALRRWFPDRDDRHRLIWDTPSRLFGFQRPGSEKRD